MKRRIAVNEKTKKKKIIGRVRQNQVKFYMTDKELSKLDHAVKSTQMTRGEYIRMLIKGKQPVAKPDIEYAEVLKQLHYIGNNIRQLAVKAYYTQNIHHELYKNCSENLDCVVATLTCEMSARVTDNLKKQYGEYVKYLEKLKEEIREWEKTK